MPDKEVCAGQLCARHTSSELAEISSSGPNCVASSPDSRENLRDCRAARWAAPVRYVVDPWIATATQGYTAGHFRGNCRSIQGHTAGVEGVGTCRATPCREPGPMTCAHTTQRNATQRNRRPASLTAHRPGPLYTLYCDPDTLILYQLCYPGYTLYCNPE